MKQRVNYRNKISAFITALMSKIRGSEPVRMTKASCFIDEALNMPIFELDLDGKILNASSALSHSWGVEPQKLEGTALLDHIHINDRLLYLTMLSNLRADCLKACTQLMHNISARKQEILVRLRIVKKTAAEDTPETNDVFETCFKHYQLYAVPVVDRAKLSGRQPYIGLVAMPAEDKMQLQLENEQLKSEVEKAIQSSKQIVDTVAHELRTPLNAVIGYADLLLHPMASNMKLQEKQEYIYNIKKSGKYLLELSASILDNTRISNGLYGIQTSSCEISELIQFCVELIAPAAQKKRLRVKCQIDHDITPVSLDKRAIQQAVLNLLTNAIKFTPEGGEININVYNDISNRELIISIRDTGVGMAAQEIGRLRQAYQQGDYVTGNDCHGIGLGLSLVDGFVKLHHGRFDIHSAQGEGTTATISLPLVDPNQSEMPNIEVARRHSVEILNQIKQAMERQYDKEQTKIGEPSDAKKRQFA